MLWALLSVRIKKGPGSDFLALSLLHAQPAHAWTVDELAARWRLQVAAQELLIGSKSLAAIAEQVGYDSEAAFNRAFKREFGMPPAGWRKNQNKADVADAPVVLRQMEQ